MLRDSPHLTQRKDIAKVSRNSSGTQTPTGLDAGTIRRLVEHADSLERVARQERFLRRCFCRALLTGKMRNMGWFFRLLHVRCPKTSGLWAARIDPSGEIHLGGVRFSGRCHPVRRQEGCKTHARTASEHLAPYSIPDHQMRNGARASSAPKPRGQEVATASLCTCDARVPRTCCQINNISRLHLQRCLFASAKCALNPRPRALKGAQ